jgi:hypothetical protein
MSHKISRLSAAAVLCLTPIAFTTAANSAEPAPDLGFARNGGVPYEQPDLGYARNGVVTAAGTPDLGRARNEVPATEPAPAASSSAGMDTETWVVLGATGAAVVGLGLAGGLLVRRRHAHLPHPV